MIDRLKRLLEIRFRISTQLYFGFGVAVALTIGASLVGWFSFNQVGDAQSLVNEGSVPELAAAFGVAQYSSELVNAAPRLSAAETRPSFARVVSSIDESRAAFEEQLTGLEGSEANERFDRIGVDAKTLFSNIEAIKQDRLTLFELADSKGDLRTEIEKLTVQLNDYLGPAIDDQLFYTVTGYRELGEPPAPRSEHFSEEEVERYRHLAELQVDVNIATQLLADAFGVSDASLVEPLRERFESAVGRIERNLSTQSAVSLPREMVPVLARLFELGGLEIRLPESLAMFVVGVGGAAEQQSGFDLIDQELRLADRQQDLLNDNRNLAVTLLSEVNGLVSAAEASAQEATDASTQAITTGRTLLLVISGISIAGAVLIIWVLVGRVLLRRLEMLSDWMRRMAGGDLEAHVEIGGRDEVADMAAALEVFRRHALEVQRLNLVEKLAEELQGKNAELETVLADLQRAQDQIVVREKLAALGQLTAGVAHEIKNPLNFVRNFSEVSEELIKELVEVIEESGEQLPEEQQSYIKEIAEDLVGNLGRIRSHGDRANRIVQDMLMMGRDSGGFQPTDINRLLDEHARLAYHSARATDADFNLDLKQDLDPEVGEIEVIPQDLGRVFLNLVSNACDATDEKRREIDVGTSGEAAYQTEDGGPYFPTLWLATRREEDRIEVRVRDNGKGMPPEVIDKIFNPFFTTKPTDRGTGLGLAISNDIVRKHGGSIHVESEAGRFTEMIVELPLTPPPGAAEEATGQTAGAAQ